MDIDKPLDDIIKTKRASKAATRGGGRGGKAPASARDRYAGNAPKSARGNAGPQQARPAGPQGGNNKAGVPAGLAAEATKIIISNLPLDVNEAAVRVGPVEISLDRLGLFARIFQLKHQKRTCSSPPSVPFAAFR